MSGIRKGAVNHMPEQQDEALTNGDLHWVANFIWGIANDVLRDLYVRGKYRDVILPMIIIRRLDAVLEDTKQAVVEAKARLDKARLVNQESALRSASGQAFYNHSPFKLKDLRNSTTQQQLRQDFEAYLDGFSPNVQEILNCFKFRNQVSTLSDADVLSTLIDKFLDPSINLSPRAVPNSDGTRKHKRLDNHGMGTIFEELVRRFNEDNNEEAGEHWTPRDAVKLMAELVFRPIEGQVESGTYLLYDGAIGTGGMLTVAEETLQSIANKRKKEVVTHLYGQEINAETYAICKADLLLKGDGDEADNIVGGPKYSTLTNDAFSNMRYDYMLSNPPYGKSWKSDMEKMGGKTGIKDPRFIIEHTDDPEYSLVTRSSDGQMLFLANMLSKMKHDTKTGSRIAEVHNGSSLFTGDAGQGESNIRRWILENDWLEAIVALPLNMFYNTGIATYIWVLSNRKAKERKGKVQLVDTNGWFTSLRKNMGKKNCELTDENIESIMETFLSFKETKQSKIFPNEEFGYWKVMVERPLRLKVDLRNGHLKRFKVACAGAGEEQLIDIIEKVAKSLGAGPYMSYVKFAEAIEKVAAENHIKLPATRLKFLQASLAERDPDAEPIVKKVHKAGTKSDPIHGLFEIEIDGKKRVVEYEPDTELRDNEQVPLLEKGGIESFIKREVLPYAPDAWIKEEATKIGYEINFNSYFYKPGPLRSLDEIQSEILKLEKETEGLLKEIVT